VALKKKQASYSEEYEACLKKPGDTYFLARSNIIGGTCLTTVFGMGTGMARYLWSPGMRVEPGNPGIDISRLSAS